MTNQDRTRECLLWEKDTKEMISAWEKDSKEAEKDTSSRRGGKRKGTKEVEKDNMGIQEKAKEEKVTTPAREKVAEKVTSDHRKVQQGKPYSMDHATTAGHRDIRQEDVHTWEKASKGTATRVGRLDTLGTSAQSFHMEKEREKARG